MRFSIIRHILSIVLLPVMVTLVVPALIQGGHPGNIGWGLPPPWDALPAVVGSLILFIGLLLLFQTISLFIAVGRGTIAPWDATKNLVIRGPYRYVRNPMISGVLAILLAEALLLGSMRLLVYFTFAAVLNAVYIPLSEEPALEERFGAQYAAYKRHVPRWIPRLKPWDGGGGDG